MKTLVVSDLHIGAGHGRAALDDDAVVATLASAFAAADRVVLLGDVIEMRQRPVRDALAAASRVLPRLVEGMGGDSEVVVLAGNHDHQLFGGWLTRRGAASQPPPLGLENAADWLPAEPLARVADLLAGGGARVRAAYPGVWLRDDVYATHGHYLDPHTTAPGLERLGAGAMARLLRIRLSGLGSVDEYERILSPIYAWMLAICERGGPELDAADGGTSSRILRQIREGGVRGNALRFGVNAAAWILGRAGLGELSGELSPEALRRTELRALATAMANLGVDADYVIFGHTHHAGPFAHDDVGEWRTARGAQLINSGCWVREGGAFLDRAAAATSPYRAGFAVELYDEGPPRLVNLLDR